MGPNLFERSSNEFDFFGAFSRIITPDSTKSFKVLIAVSLSSKKLFQSYLFGIKFLGQDL